MHRKQLTQHPDFEMYESGTVPQLLIMAGVHGDEYELIDPLTRALAKYSAILPPFWYIPQASPSAVQLRTRKNEHGLDLNRNFYTDSTEPEIRRILEIVGTQHFELSVSFHEDPEDDQFYIYDIGRDLHENNRLKQFNSSLLSSGFKLLTGFDDPRDQALNHEFADGYRRFVTKDTDEDKGMIEDYFLRKRNTENVWLPEIPGLLPLSQKEFIIDKFVKELMGTA